MYNIILLATLKGWNDDHLILDADPQLEMSATNMCGVTNPQFLFNTNDQQQSACHLIDGETPHFYETVHESEHR